MHRQKGFTLIELMIVIAIIGILAVIAIPRFVDLIDKAREGATKGCLGAIRGALVIYYGDNEGLYPYSIDSAWGGVYGAYGGTATLPPFSAYIQGGVLPYATIRRTHAGDRSRAVALDDAIAGPGAAVGGWLFRSVRDANWGRVWVNSNTTDSRRIFYSTY